MAAAAAADVVAAVLLVRWCGDDLSRRSGSDPSAPYDSPDSHPPRRAHSKHPACICTYAHSCRWEGRDGDSASREQIPADGYLSVVGRPASGGAGGQRALSPPCNPPLDAHPPYAGDVVGGNYVDGRSCFLLRFEPKLTKHSARVSAAGNASILGWDERCACTGIYFPPI